ncbi:MAG: phage tail protein [Oscillibacter sp.]|nr:phage tail protein [Oscillibacter sp.]
MEQAAAYINLEIYEDDVNLLGVAKVQLPSIAYPCVTISGAGMMGEMEIPLYGMVNAMTLTINWLTPHGDAVRLMSPEKHQLDMRVAEEYWDVEQAEVGLWADKYVVIVRPKNASPGTVAPMGNADTSGEYAVYYFAAYRDGKQLWEVDKRSMKCVIDGVDYMAPVRKALGKG